MAGIPSKEAVRSYLNQRARSHTPPPSPEEIRRQLGWGLIPHNAPRERPR